MLTSLMQSSVDINCDLMSETRRTRAVAIITKINNQAINEPAVVDGSYTGAQVAKLKVSSSLWEHFEVMANHPWTCNHTKLTYYVEEDPIDFNTDPLGWWCENQGRSPLLSKFACAFVQPGHHLRGNNFTPLRSSLKPPKVNMLVLLHQTRS